MKKSKKFTPEFRERAVRMVQEQRGDHPSLWAAVVLIAPKLECVPQTLLSCRFSSACATVIKLLSSKQTNLRQARWLNATQAKVIRSISASAVSLSVRSRGRDLSQRFGYSERGAP